MSAPRVSVIMPVLDGERFLAQAVDSVIDQRYTDWELLIVDDGSTDESPAIARGYARRMPDAIRTLATPGDARRGVSAARNLGLQHARGELIALLDADDVWLPDKLAEQVALIDAHPEVGMLYGNTLYWYGWADAEPGTAGAVDAAAAAGRRDHTPDLGVPPDTVPEPTRLLLRQLRGEAASPCTCSVLLRRALVERVGGCEESFRGMHEDQVLYAKMLLEAPAFVSGRCWDRYRRYAGPSSSICTTAERRGEVVAARIRYLEWLAGHLAAKGFRATELQRAVAEALRAYRHPHLHAVERFARQAVRRAARSAVRGLRSAGRRLGIRRTVRPRSVEPVSRHWGWDRGEPVDRHYIERFLERHAADVRGRVLEVGDDGYTRRFGGERVTRADVLHVDDGTPSATIVADLGDEESGAAIPSDAFDCVILTQTLHLIYDVRTALRTLRRVLKPDGALLATVPGISQTTDDRWRASWYWSFTPASLGRLAREAFPAGRVEVASHGNVLAAVAFLHGLAREELRPDELAFTDRDFPLVVTLRAIKPAPSPVAAGR